MVRLIVKIITWMMSLESPLVAELLLTGPPLEEAAEEREAE